MEKIDFSDETFVGFSDGENINTIDTEEEIFIEDSFTEIQTEENMEEYLMGFSKDYEVSSFTDGNADVLQALDEASQDLVEEIEKGDVKNA